MSSGNKLAAEQLNKVSGGVGESDSDPIEASGYTKDSQWIINGNNENVEIDKKW